MRTLNLIAIQAKYLVEPAVVHKTVTDQAPAPGSDQLRNLVEVVKLYRHQEQAYFEKIKRKEFAKDELHHMKKTQEKLDLLLQRIEL